MSFPPFPIAGVQLDGTEPSRAIDGFLKQRADERWVLLGGHAAQSMDQLWTAWIQATRNELRGAMVARSIDAEFLRYLAGTHHISEAFARAGLQDGQTAAWVLHLPTARGEANDLGHVQPVAGPHETFQEGLEALVKRLGWSFRDDPMSFSIEGARRLGADLDGWAEERRSESLVAHVLMADDQSSSHR